ncbi:glycosyl hydrolase family 28-related protein [Actinoplanes sp. NEAU-A12]|uniref:Glycosyl hydrolase family 28-related protein n=1 Tax=Actinoplanes sandaracinus TaxID=3045177 RepID=A0ABT6WKH0_9ACTN|nr:right-handed parallel beta-helix repeat-containing protein [Actinoplanes sandaracinus]MDI6100213.1 glycosyl hydrolase family 28-related protein [Actinoplanes sandaracinus]
MRLPLPLPLPVRSSRVVAALAVGLPATVAALAAPAAAAAAASVAPYSLTSSVSPAPLVPESCATDPACVVAPVPRGGTSDDAAALQQAIATAAGRTVPAVVAADGSVTTPATTATVLLSAGTYRLTKGLVLPPNVNLRGAGIGATTLLLDPTLNWRNFSYSFLIRAADTKQAGSTNLVSDLTVNGNCRTGAGAFDDAVLPGSPAQICDFRTALGAHANTGGGISAGDRWTVRQVRFTNFEYFKLWINGTTGVQALDNRFDNRGGAESDGEDNIGGGGRNADTVIQHNQFDATINGNAFDFTNAIRTTVRDNVVLTTPAVAAARGVSEYGNLYFEGVVGATATGNHLEGAHIVLKSNSDYSHTGNNKDVTEPRDSLVAGNTILDSATVGVAVAYDDYLDADGTAGTPGGWNDSSTVTTDHIVRPGGNNIVRDNVIERSRQSGILVYGSTAAKNAADTVSGNRIVNAGFGGSTTYNTGAGWFDTAGIGLSVGSHDAIHGNTVVDDQATPTTWYGVHVGARKAASRPTFLTLTGPNGVTNTATGVIGAPVRTAAQAPEAPTALTAGGNRLTWEESYASGNPIGGYLVLRNGVPVTSLPVGSATIPDNLLDADAASLESAAAGTAGWTVSGAASSVSRSDTAGAVGTASLRLTALSAGQISAYSRKVPAAVGTTYTSVASFQAAGAGRRVRAGLAFTDATGKVTRLGSANVATVDTATGWMTSSYSAAAPAGAVTVQSFLMVENAAVGESHLLDRLGLVAGTATEQWTAPDALSGRYQVVATRTGNGEFSAVTAVTAP